MTDQLTASRTSDGTGAPRPRGSATVVWTVAAVATGVALVVTRLTGITRSMWWDEAFTAQRYVRGGAEVIFDPAQYSPTTTCSTAC